MLTSRVCTDVLFEIYDISIKYSFIWTSIPYLLIDYLMNTFIYVKLIENINIPKTESTCIDWLCINVRIIYRSVIINSNQ